MRMKKILLEGTPEQIANLKELMDVHKGELPEIKEGVYIDNLWHIDDVKSTYDCIDEDALDVLDKALTNDAAMEVIWYGIHEHAELFRLPKKDKEE